ncbi:alpha/beta hydrolase [Agrococcus sp. Marseille-P2731]|uniref:alpha/beta hydrolase n=1 Tax=Agrococcus sp. Marseille-P2731 TaxID=1841862 RepID=UPI000A91CD11|nr:CocE/NonD family hydrolase [Agrococcus sp. Marseille-P2731]
MNTTHAPEQHARFDATSVEFGDPDAPLRGTLYLPVGAENVAGVALGHGWGMVAGGDLEDYAKVIATKGIAALTFDFRRLGKSGGEPRQELDPFDQIEDYRNAVTFLGAQVGVAAARIGVWGSSYSGGHVLVVGATDSRVRAVVSQVPTISGYAAGLRKTAPDRLATLHERFHADRAARLRGEPPTMITSVSADPDAPVAYPGPDSHGYMIGQSERCPEWRNESTLKSLELARTYEPGAWIDRIGPKALLMIVASADKQTPTDLQLAAFNRALEPKRLEILDGGHYRAYTEEFERTSTAAAEWFAEHL